MLVLLYPLTSPTPLTPYVPETNTSTTASCLCLGQYIKYSHVGLSIPCNLVDATDAHAFQKSNGQSCPSKLGSSSPSSAFKYVRLEPIFITSTSMAKKHRCTCGCGQLVVYSTRLRHLSLKGPKFLAAQSLADNPWVLKRSVHARSPDTRRQPPRKRLRAQRTPSPSDSPTPPDPLTGAPSERETALSASQRSAHATRVINHAQNRRWQPNHRRATVEDQSESDSDRGADTEIDWVSDESDNEDSDEESLLHASPGQEGVSLWDLLGKGFLEEATALG